MKKAISVLLCLCLALSVFTFVPFAASAAEVTEESVGASSGTTGSCRWSLDDEGNLTISGNGAMGDYSYYSSSPWGANIISVIIEDGVTSIGERAFSSCTGLTSVTIPDSVTSIGNYAFYNCTGLIIVTIPDSVTSIGIDAFYGTTWYNNQPNGLVYAGKVAYKYKGTMPNNTFITIQDGTKGIADYAFRGCTGLTSVMIPDSVTSIGEMAFSGCTGLTSVTIPDSVTRIGYSAFDGTAWYNDQPDGLIYAGKVAYTYNGFMPDNTSIILQDGTKGIADSAFVERTGLTSVIIPDSVTSIGDFAFGACTGLASVMIPDSVTSIGIYAFDGCRGLKSVTIGNSVTRIGDDAFSGCTGLKSVTIGNGVTSIGDDAFYRCTGLTSVTIPDSVTSIGDRALGYYHNNGYIRKVAGFTIYGKQGSEAERYASDNGFIFVSEYCMVSGMSNYCQAVEARKIEVGDTVAVTFKVPEDFTIVDFQWGLNYDNDMLELTGINSFDNEIMLVNSNAESYDVIGSYFNISTPAGVAKDGELVTFNFTVKQSGETTVDFNVVDMTIRIYGEDQILVENGEIKNICTHKTTRTISGYPATCTQAGLTDEIVCAECGKVMTKAAAIPAKGHTPVADQGKSATCTETGLTEGSHCSVCNEVLVEQTEIPALGHLPVIDPYLAPTCSHEGHTIGSYCERCGEVYVASETIPKLPHTVVIDEAVEPSCGHTGLTEGSHCSACGEVIVAQEVIPALTHQYEIVPAVPATYTKEGSTDGVRCKLCGEWLIEPQVTPKKTIDFTFGDVNEDGKVNIRDVTAIQRFLAEYTDLTERQRGAADVNFDGVVDVRDATLLQMYFAEFDVVLG